MAFPLASCLNVERRSTTGEGVCRPVRVSTPEEDRPASLGEAKIRAGGLSLESSKPMPELSATWRIKNPSM